MDYIFIDTSVFVSENFLEGRKIKEIYRLAADRELRLVLPLITFNEILARIRINTFDALVGQREYRRKTSILRNVPEFKNRFEKIDYEKTVLDLQGLFKERIISIGTEILPYPTLNIDSIFEKYFTDSYPFNSGRKKNEFPDAFAVATLEDWCKKLKRKCFVIAGDNDINEYKSSNFKIVPIDKYLDTIIRKVAKNKIQQTRIETATTLFRDNKHNLEKEIEYRLIFELEYHSSYFQNEYWEIENIDVHTVTVSLNSDFQISSITEYNIILDTTATCEIYVELEYGGNKEPFNLDIEKPDEEISKIIKIPVSFEVDIPLAGDEFMEIELYELNNKRDLEI